MSRKIFISVILAVLALCGCERRPLHDLGNTHYIRIYIDEQIKNVTTGFYNPDYDRPSYKSPTALRIVLADPLTGAAMAERYLRNTAVDGRGRYYDGYIIADPGEYSLYAYNVNTETTLLRNSNSHRDVMAYTDDIASHIYSKYHMSMKSPSRKRIVYDCDHLFVADCGHVEIPYLPYSEKLDTLTTVEGDYFLAESIVKSYYLQVKVKGMNYVSSVASLMDGVAGSAYLWERRPDYEDEVWLSFDMTASKEAEDSEEEVILYTTFGTFGKIPDIDSGLEIALDFTTKSGTPYAEVLDITKEFETLEAIENQWIIIDRVIEVPLPVEDDPGGMKPGVGNWGDIYTEIII